MTTVNIKEFIECKELYAGMVLSSEDSGFDLVCPNDETIKARETSHKIKLGIGAAMINNDQRLAYMLLPRSSTGKTALRLSNSVGIIDKGYNNEICAIVDNISDIPFEIKKGDKLFQLVQFSGLPYKEYSFVDALPESKRGMGGFGSTGRNVFV